MAELDDARAQLNEKRLADDAARTALLRARELADRLGREADRLSRSAADPASAEALERTRGRIAALNEEVEQLELRRLDAAAAHREELERFARFDDPPSDVSRLPDDVPVALFPLRLETRFKLLGGDGAPRHELWVRVFPDDALVDSFQPELSESELASARGYWGDVWRAGGDESGRRAAWRALARSNGAGRAKWITEVYAPLHPEREPVAAAGKHILVVVPDEPVPDAEQAPIAAYWSAVWQSRGGERQTAYEDLVTALGSDRAAEVDERLVPANLLDGAVAPDPSLTVEVAFLDLPAPADVPTTQASWARAARASLLPERLVLMGFEDGAERFRVVGKPIPSELQIGPDPSATPDQQLRADGADLSVPGPLLWTVDFDEAVRVGMGFAVPLAPEQAARGFDRIFVLGVRLSSDAEDGATRVEALIRDHQRSRKGLSLLGQGTPTNNTDESASGYTWWEDPDAAYHHFFELDHDDDPDDWRLRRDGAWLAGVLGIDRAVLQGSVGYFGADQAEARAMNVALWPATLGYFMEQMMAPAFADETIEQTRAFFNRHVLGRGTAPALRIGRQPYGVLPATVWSRIAWYRAEGYPVVARKAGLPPARYLDAVRALLDRASALWTDMARGVATVADGAAGDPQRRLLDIVGLHPTSVEFYQRYAETFEQLYNRLKLSFFGLTFNAHLVARNTVQAGLATLARLGYEHQEGPYPPILDKFFLRTPSLLRGSLVDAATSDTAGLSIDRPDGDNYLGWLQTAARTSHNALRRQEGFAHGPPTPLLYLMLHHALDLGYVETVLLLHRRAELMTEAEYRLAREEPRFLDIEEARTKDSRWSLLYQPEPRLTDGSNVLLGDFIPTTFESERPYLRDQLEALDVLKTSTTGALERAFVEHLDCASYRFDAWRSALVGVELEFMRDGGESERSRRGLLVGAYGWLEDLRPAAAPQPVRLDEDLAGDFQRPEDAPLVRDPANRGHIHAPSPDHAVTAAILRNGYLANATPENPETLSIDLTSERVRLALATVEGIRNGQPLSALLGYQLERGLHDSGELFLDRVIYPLRQAFPLAGNRLESTRDESQPITAVEARNVVDGLAFAEHIEASGATNYPYGLTGLPDLDDLTDTTTMTAAAIGATIDATVDRMRSVSDAVADLAMAEGVFQVVKGNYDRAAGTLDAFSKGNFPPTPEVAETPRSGKTLTHRIALHLEGGLDPADPSNTTPRAQGEPALNRWLTGRLPAMAEIFAAVEYVDAGGTERRLTPSMADLGLEPIDLFYLLDAGSERELPGFDDLLIHHAVRESVSPPRDDAVFGLLYKPAPVTGFTLFEVAPLVRSLRGVVLGSRPLRPSDVVLAGEAGLESDTSVVPRPEKVATVVAALQTEAADLRTLAGALESAVGPGAAPAAAQAAALANLDVWATDYVDALRRISPFGLRAAGLTTPWERARPLFAELHATLAALIVRWEDKLTAFADAIQDYDLLPPATPEDERFPLLVSAGRIVSTAVVAPFPATPDLMRTMVLGFRDDLDDDLTDLRARLAAGRRLGAFFAAADAFAPRVALRDQVPLDLATFPDAILSIADDLRTRAAQAVADVDGRIAAADDILGTVAGAPAREQPDRVAQAGKAVLGEGFVVLPEFTLPAAQRAEWASAFAARAGLLIHLTSGPDAIPFPVDDWLHGVGRVREKARELEAAALLGEALSVADPLELVPLQFPFRPGDAWLGLRFPEPPLGAALPEGDRLLYTAHLTPGAEVHAGDPGRRYCGVLIEEWSELVPAELENSGLAFHFDRPSSEAPQTILLAAPPQFTGAWRWQDLVDTLHETLDFARLRAVEPTQIDGTELSRFLPALISAVTLYPFTAMLNLAENNGLSARLEEVVP